MKIQQLAQDEKKKRPNIQFQKMVYKVDAVRATGKLIESYNVIWHKREGDAPVPTTRRNLLTQYLDTYHRGDQMPPFPNMLIAEENDAVA